LSYINNDNKTNKSETRYQPHDNPLPTIANTLQNFTFPRLDNVRESLTLPDSAILRCYLESMMTQNQFLALCMKYAIEPSVALENDDLREALRARDANEVERILREEF